MVDGGQEVDSDMLLSAGAEAGVDRLPGSGEAAKNVKRRDEIAVRDVESGRLVGDDESAGKVDFVRADGAAGGEDIFDLRDGKARRFRLLLAAETQCEHGVASEMSQVFKHDVIIS